MTTPPPTAFITTAPRDLAGWAASFDAESLPVLADSAAELEQWRPVEDAVDAHRLAACFGADPLMLVKLLAHVGRLRRGRGGGPETLTEALVMLGIPPFFRAFGPQPTVEQQLADHPAALAGFRAVLARSHRAARFALGFAAHRMDPDAALLHDVTLLHDVAELLLWSRAPDLALEIARRRQAAPSVRSAVLQRAVLNIELRALQHALMTAWGMPAALVGPAGERAEAAPQGRIVELAVRLARHTARGWDDAALPDDLRAIGELLQLTPEHTLHLLHDIDGR